MEVTTQGFAIFRIAARGPQRILTKRRREGCGEAVGAGVLQIMQTLQGLHRPEA